MSGPLRPPLNEGETQSLQFPAIYKKCLGVAFLSNQRVLWVATDAQSKAQKVEMAWAAVKDHMVSPTGQAKAMIKINPVVAGSPPVILEVLEQGGLTAHEVLAKARGAILRALKATHGQAGASSSSSSGSRAGSSAPPPGKSLDDEDNRHGKAGWAKRQRTGPLSSARGGRPLDLDAMQSSSSSAIMGTAAQQAKQRAALLAGDAALRAQHAEMVDGGILSEAEFWHSRKSMLVGEAAAAKAQRQGTRSALLADVRPTVENNKQVFKLTAQVIHQIFLMYPAVQRAYQAKVPTEFTEKEFWVKYFQSQYYTRDKCKAGGPQISAGDDMFSRYAAEVEEERKAAAEAVSRGGSSATAANAAANARLSGAHGVVDPTIDLAAQWADHHGRELDERSPAERAGAPEAQQVIGILNRHADLIMKPKGGRGSAAAAAAGASQDDPYTATELPELREPAAEKVQPLTLENTGQYAGGAAAATSATAPATTDSSTAAEQQQQQPLVVRALNLRAALTPPARALEVLHTCSKEGQSSGAAAVNPGAYPQEFVTTLHRHFQIIGELLRHFYAALSSSGSSAAAAAAVAPKLDRLVQKMESKYEELQQLRSALPHNAAGGQQSALIKPLTDCLNHAFQKHEEHKAAVAERAAAAAAAAGANVSVLGKRTLAGSAVTAR